MHYARKLKRIKAGGTARIVPPEIVSRAATGS